MKQFNRQNISHVLFVLMFLAKPALAVEDVLVYAAASTNNAVSKIIEAYNNTHENKIKASFASSSTLAKQIEAGAPAQIYISANPKWMDYLQQRNQLVKDTRIDLLANKIVLIAPLNASLSVRMAKDFDLPREIDGRFCMGDPEHVPAGIYSKQALSAMGWWKDLSPRIVATKDVRAALAFVERGECAAGIVYATDASSSKKVDLVAKLPADSHKPVVYPIALLNSASDSARDFLSYLQSKQANSIFKEYGFTLSE